MGFLRIVRKNESSIWVGCGCGRAYFAPYSLGGAGRAEQARGLTRQHGPCRQTVNALIAGQSSAGPQH